MPGMGVSKRVLHGSDLCDMTLRCSLGIRHQNAHLGDSLAGRNVAVRKSLQFVNQSRASDEHKPLIEQGDFEHSAFVLQDTALRKPLAPELDDHQPFHSLGE